MSEVKKRDIQPVPEINTQSDDKFKFDDTVLFRLNNEAVGSITNVFALYAMSLDFDGHEINIAEEIKGILFGYDPLDPTKTTLTVSPEWKENYDNYMQSVLKRFEEIGLERMERMKQAIEARQEISQIVSSSDDSQESPEIL